MADILRMHAKEIQVYVWINCLNYTYVVVSLIPGIILMSENPIHVRYCIQKYVYSREKNRFRDAHNRPKLFFVQNFEY